MSKISPIHGHEIQEPTCPGCGAKGIKFISYEDGIDYAFKLMEDHIAPYRIIFCEACGHIYGVVPAIDEMYRFLAQGRSD